MSAVITLFLEFVVLATVKDQQTLEVANSTASILILIFSFSFCFMLLYSAKLNVLYSHSLVLGYFLRIAILYFDMYGHRIYTLPNTVGDATVFYREAKTTAEAIANDITLPNTRGNFPVLMGRLFSIIGTNRLYGQFLIMLCSIVALVFFAYSLDHLEIDSSVKENVFKLVCLLPNFAILSSAFLRESLVYMFISLSLFCFVLWISYNRLIYYIFAVTLVFPASYFHSGAISLLVGYISVLAIYDNRNRRSRLTIRNVVIMIALFGITSTVLTNYSDTFLGKFGSLDSIEDIANTSSLGRTTYAKYVGNSNNPINLVIYTAPRIFFFLFSPLPWMWGGLGDIIAFFFSSLYYLYVIRIVVLYFKSGVQKNRAIIIAFILITFGMTFVFAWGSSNGGTAARHRDKMVILYGLLLSLCLDGVREFQEEVYNLSTDYYTEE